MFSLEGVHFPETCYIKIKNGEALVLYLDDMTLF